MSRYIQRPENALKRANGKWKVVILCANSTLSFRLAAINVGLRRLHFPFLYPNIICVMHPSRCVIRCLHCMRNVRLILFG